MGVPTLWALLYSPHGVLGEHACERTGGHRWQALWLRQSVNRKGREDVAARGRAGTEVGHAIRDVQTDTRFFWSTGRSGGWGGPGLRASILALALALPPLGVGLPQGVLGGVTGSQGGPARGSWAAGPSPGGRSGQPAPSCLSGRLWGGGKKLEWPRRAPGLAAPGAPQVMLFPSGALKVALVPELPM